MKKIIFTLALILALACVFTACNKTPKTEKLEHTYATTYMMDDDYHWFKCIGCKAIKGKELHTLDDEGVCTVCDSTPGVHYDLSDDRTYAIVTGYEGTATKVKIAEEYEGVPVKSIADCAFYYCSSLTSVVIPDSVTSIGNRAFDNCSSLTSVVIPDSVTSIGVLVFYNCSSLTSVVIGNSVTRIGDYAFCWCSRLTSVVIPDSVTSIDAFAFYNCTSLTDVYYTGSADDWVEIFIASSNSLLESVTIHYNYIPEE